MRGIAHRLTAGALAVGLLVTVTGCDEREKVAKPDGASRQLAQKPLPRPVADRVPLGDSTLGRKARGLTVLVVGDSWARGLGVGLAKADHDHRNMIVNAGEAGCGLMQPVQLRIRGRMLPAPARCNDWPRRWRSLVAKYRPSAVLLEIGFWDSQSVQRIAGDDDVSSIVAPMFRERFDAQIDRAIRILSSGGARVYVPNVVDYEGAARANSDAMNDALRAAVQRNRRARLLDLRGQLCTPAKVCPKKVANLEVYDRTAHPAAATQARLGAWILNSVYLDFRKGSRASAGPGPERGAQRGAGHGAGPESQSRTSSPGDTRAESRSSAGTPGGTARSAPGSSPGRADSGREDVR